ncbi:MAG: hypothetical protein QM629_16915 [Parafilimonas sp.]
MQQRIANPDKATAAAQPDTLQNMQSVKTVIFQYTGNTALSVIGNVTRKNYRFNFPGDVQHVALNDAGAMAAIPVLRRVKPICF